VIFFISKIYFPRLNFKDLIDTFRFYNMFFNTDFNTPDANMDHNIDLTLQTLLSTIIISFFIFRDNATMAIIKE